MDKTKLNKEQGEGCWQGNHFCKMKSNLLGTDLIATVWKKCISNEVCSLISFHFSNLIFSDCIIWIFDCDDFHFVAFCFFLTRNISQRLFCSSLLRYHCDSWTVSEMEFTAHTIFYQWESLCLWILIWHSRMGKGEWPGGKLFLLLILNVNI